LPSIARRTFPSGLLAAYHSYLGDVVNKAEFHNITEHQPDRAADEACRARETG
jgi:hypothetical protein